MISAVALSVTLLAPAPPATAAPPSRVGAAIDSLTYSDLGETTIRRIASGVAVETTGLQASGTIDCGGDPACGPLDGATLTIAQELGIVVVGDVLTPVVRGRTSAVVSASGGDVRLSAEFAGRLVGGGTCDVVAASCDFDLVGALRGPGSNQLDIELTASLTTGGSGLGQWTAISGSAVANVIIDVIGAG